MRPGKLRFHRSHIYIIYIITLHACTRGKVIGSVVIVVGTKITKSRKIGVRQLECYMPPNCQKSRKNLMLASNCLGQPTSTTNHAFSPATPINNTYQYHALFPLCMLDVKIGKGRRVIKSISRHYAELQLTQGTRLSIPHCYYNGNVAMVHGVCALESSSYYYYQLHPIAIYVSVVMR